MSTQNDEILKRPLYVFDLPQELLVTLQQKGADVLPSDTECIPIRVPQSEKSSKSERGADVPGSSTSCGLCNISFPSLIDQRSHVRSDWHGYNLKQKLRGLQPVSEINFEKLVGDLDESISGTESSASEDEDESTRAKETVLSTLLKKQTRIHNTKDTEVVEPKRKRGAGNPPLIWFSSSILPSNTAIGVYKALFTDIEQQNSDILEVLRLKQLKSARVKPNQNGSNGVPLSSSITGPNIFLCMIGGGHFAAMVVSLTPKLGKKATGVEERQAIVLAHKTFHRYTTRRKQGGSQSANDSANGAAHSAGAGIRRYNETALETEVRALLSEWRDLIDGSELLFVRATGSTNRRTLFGPYEGQVLHHNDSRNRSFPFSTRRATQAELMRAFVELTRMKVREVDEAALAAAVAEDARLAELAAKAVMTPSKPTIPKISKEEEAALLHTSQLQALIRRSKAPATLSYMSQNSVSPNFIFHPPTSQANHHASTPLHLAASVNSPVMVIALLTKGGSDPTVSNGEGKPAFDVAGDRATRDAFRVARSELGETKWQWDAAHCPPPITKAEAEEREASGRAESQKAEADRRKAESDRLQKEAVVNGDGKQAKKLTGKALGATEMTGAELREQEARGLTPEMRAKLERERRARAAEERMRRMTAGVGGGGAGR